MFTGGHSRLWADVDKAGRKDRPLGWDCIRWQFVHNSMRCRLLRAAGDKSVDECFCLRVIHRAFFIGVGYKPLTPVGDSRLSTKSYNPVGEARDNMLAGLCRGKAGQVTTITTNRLLESEDS
ncbi:hypothetical protein MESS2_1250034 [Mesorhizobium metallidurans STM 2683]|uniref:Uncharacterized protein n=1 Tax=Mesorhizobium metallidurans STM 2683 TaxID=1297569 RepID=M5EI32_9HYPH|nr:hypothetical protein MESS2_1250034 [Mesorhizobium metallidurans STM 2683]